VARTGLSRAVHRLLVRGLLEQRLGTARVAHLVETHRVAQQRAGQAAPARRAAAAAERAALSRRQFLQLSGWGMVVAAGCAPGSARTPARAPVTVAVVGAGLAGLHCAYRLRQAGIRADVYEAAGRVGGRVFSWHGHFPDRQVAELGGELIDSVHRTMRALVAELSLGLDDLWRAVPGGTAAAEELWFFSGRRVSEAELLEPMRELAPRIAGALAALERDPDSRQALDRLSISEWLDGSGVAPLLRALIEERYRADFGLEPDQQSALNLLSSIGHERPDAIELVADSDERYHVHEGNGSITDRLASRLDRGQLRLGHRLLAARSRSDGRCELALATAGGATVERSYERVVFALPFSTLRLADLRHLRLSPDKRRAIAEIGYGQVAKLLAGLDRPVWRDLHGSSGSVLTDNGLQFLWDGSRGQPGRHAILVNYMGGDRALAIGSGSATTQVQAMLPLVEQIFPGVAAAYRTGSAVRMHWPGHPHVRAGFLCYRPGQWQFEEALGRQEGNLHFCGEHTSRDFWGWMEGAAESGARAAAELLDALGVRRPPALQALLALAVPGRRRWYPDRSERAPRRTAVVSGIR
jgi:monoamine oxidase